MANKQFNSVDGYSIGNASVVIDANGNVSANYLTASNNAAVTGTLGVTGNATVGNLTVGTGTGGSLIGSNLVSANFLTGTLTTAAQPNVTSLGPLTSLVVTGNTTSGNFVGTFANGNSSISIPAANGNINITAGGGNVELVITSTGVNVAGTLTATGNTTSGNFYANSGTVGASLLTGTLTTNAQPNITSVGTLTALDVNGNLTVSNTAAVFNANSASDALRINQLGTGNALVVEDETNPDSTPTVIAANGWVSIGGTTPTNRLQVVIPDNSALGNGIEVTTANNTGFFRLSTGWSGGFLPSFVGRASNNSGSFGYGMLFNAQSGNASDTANGVVTFSARDNAGTANVGSTQTAFAFRNYVTDMMVINGAGNVGIGNSSPQHKLSVTGTMNVSSNANVGNLGTARVLATANVTAPQLISNTASGTAPLVVTSNTVVTNLNADLLDGYQSATAATANTVAARDTNGNLSANFFIGNGSQLTGITASFPIANGNSNVNVPAANGNVNISAAGNANVFVVTGTGANISGTANVTGNLAAGNISANIANLTTANVTGNLTAGNITTGSGSGGNITGANVISANTFVGALANGNSSISIPTANGNINLNTGGNATPELIITTTGVNVNGTVNATGNANVGNIGATNGVFTNVSGNGSGLSSITGANVTGNVANATYATTAGSATTAGTVTTNAQPNITSTGTLTSLTVSGNVSANNLSTTNKITAGNGLQVTAGGATITGNIDVTGNFNVTGNLNYSNVTDLVVGDPLIYMGANNTGDTVDLGIVASYNNGTYQHTGIARNYTNDTWTFFDGVAAEPTTVIDWANATYPTVKMGNLLTTGTANITGNANVGNLGTAQVLATANVTAPQLISNTATGTAPLTVTSTTRVANLNVSYANVSDFINVTAPGTGTGYLVFANATTGNVAEYTSAGISSNLANNSITATTFVGALSGTATSATTAGTVTTNAQPNITSVGTLTSLTSSGNVSISTTSSPYLIINTGNTTNKRAAVSFGQSGVVQFETGVDVSVSNTRSYYVYDGPAAATRMLIDANGNVGIGTTSPGYNLDIGTTTTTASQTIRAIAATGYDTQLKLMEAADTYGFTIRNANGSGLNILRHSANATGTSAMFIGRDTGNVGIGNTAPVDRLSVNGNIVSSGYVIESVSGAVSAAGTVQANATVLASQINVVSTVVTGAGVQLPNVVAGIRVTIMNTSANALLVYPPSGEAINSLAANAAYSQPAGARLDFVSTSATQWYTLNATYG